MVDESSIDKDRNVETSEAHSKTSIVKEYFIGDHGNGFITEVIDTPGFMDTSGPMRDDEILKQIKD